MIDNKKIKVVHVVYSFELGGIETLLLSLLNGLDKKTFEVHLITLTNDRLKLIPLLDSNIIVHSLDYTPKKLKSFFGLFNGCGDLVKLLKSINPDITHSHLASFPFLFINVAIKLSKLKLVNIRTVHTAGLFYENQDTLSNKVKLLAEKVAMKLVKTNIISVSSIVHKNNIFYFKNFAKDIKLISNGVNLTKYDKDNYKNISKENFGFKDSSIVVSYVARLDEGKNHDLLINIFKDVLKEIPNAMLCLAGDGLLKEYLIQKTKKSGLEKNIIFLGSINNIPELLSITDIAVFPSSFEGFSLVMLEKFAMKLPMVASDIEPFKEIAEDKKTAFLVSLKDKKRFTSSIITLCKDAKLRKTMGEKAYLVAQNFSIDNTIKLHEQYYLECLKKECKK